MPTEILRLENIRRELELSRDVRQTIIPNLSMSVMAGEFVAITGPSGSGKSTLLYIMGGLDKPTYGKVLLDGEDVTGKNETEMTRIRNVKIGFIYQFHFLLPEFNALENVSMPMMIGGRFHKKEIRERAMMLLDTVGLENKYTNKPSQLSGGQQQRVAIARALANEPKVLLGDEPTGNLDSKSARNVYELFDRLNRELNQTVIVVTHDEELANRAGRRIHLVDGMIESDSMPKRQALSV
ncbi:MAG: ABC transporter ATP-binding protein [Chlorobium sp.]|jgi:lipoprotein-releasing system ATP-binding protein|uniref:ABC transporter ATP-binding protein n=1 Tax=Chlorobium sp. TaxID=1095 RepID=UPI0025B87375|nr:ABC transporter ATP-binding protein [Chlorobium sp.]MCF8217245.1 ABC transporter ATP-binding protein [Chlorobium sp.]MCF8272103.1 ABC transporter ATP-binding protein [Chlorobium sp.]MCF8288464.1 ABC transporter ATP-binding protein [Chlorobium sp.]MCF8292054.1 ABC transporter ATP-binding protein [Chlorobium sp.]MCF8386156.1 ABC transporter ATP-binding protein [Chlorobium sp.]